MGQHVSSKQQQNEEGEEEEKGEGSRGQGMPREEKGVCVSSSSA